MPRYDEDLFAPFPGKRQKSQPLPPIVWFVILTSIVSIAVAVIYLNQTSKATSQFSKLTQQLQHQLTTQIPGLPAQSNSGVTVPSINYQQAYQQVVKALQSTTPTKSP
jgi:hypothetical protein